MGRPLKKDINGVDVIGLFSGNSGIVVNFYDASLRTNGVIVKQRGAKTFVVTQAGNLGDTSSGKYVTAVLKNGEPAAYGEMQIVAYLTGGADASAVNVAKITKRIITSFTGARYTWRLTNYADSTVDQIELTAL
jgi:hypothetical protein